MVRFIGYLGMHHCVLPAGPDAGDDEDFDELHAGIGRTAGPSSVYQHDERLSRRPVLFLAPGRVFDRHVGV